LDDKDLISRGWTRPPTFGVEGDLANSVNLFEAVGWELGIEKTFLISNTVELCFQFNHGAILGFGSGRVNSFHFPIVATFGSIGELKSRAWSEATFFLVPVAFA
jgi:hypothetical protein